MESSKVPTGEERDALLQAVPATCTLTPNIFFNIERSKGKGNLYGSGRM